MEEHNHTSIDRVNMYRKVTYGKHLPGSGSMGDDVPSNGFLGVGRKHGCPIHLRHNLVRHQHSNSILKTKYRASQTVSPHKKLRTNLHSHKFCKLSLYTTGKVKLYYCRIKQCVGVPNVSRSSSSSDNFYFLFRPAVDRAFHCER
jgi:hypothetical protein